MTDKDWVKLKDKFCAEYVAGVRHFLGMATKSADALGRIRCPCKGCNNTCFKRIEEVKKDIFLYGFMPDYTVWIHHGEPFQLRHTSNVENSQDNSFENFSNGMSNDIPEMLEDICRATNDESSLGEGIASTGYGTMSVNKDDKLARLINDAKQPLFPGCEKYSKLSFLVKMLNNKIITNSSDKSFNLNLELFKDALPSGETLPTSYYNVKKYMEDLGFSYYIIDACPNNCVLFRGSLQGEHKCPECGKSRYKPDNGKGKKVAEKRVRYFPLKDRLQRLFTTKDIAKDMRWHKEKRIDDDKLRHPADGKTWKQFDKDHAWFAADPRNVRLALSSDGFNPFGNMSNSHSMWPVILTPYNLPPWSCMKESVMFLSVLIPDNEYPGKKIHVYLEPLVEELNELWNLGVRTFDAHTGQFFQLHVALLWTINDFPAYGMLSGWCTRGKLACPVCSSETCYMRLQYGKKECYMAHRRWLDTGHPWRRSRKFDGKPENRMAPKILSADDLLKQLDVVFPSSRGLTLSPVHKKRRVQNGLNWRRRAALWDLPYWRTIQLRHNLDVMHIEKNISETVLGTLMDIDGKTKDTINARKDLELMGIRKELHLQRDDGKVFMPPACYTLKVADRRKLCEWLKTLKFPDSYASNISRCVTTDDSKIYGMKSHDHHIFMQRLLPIVAQGLLREDVYPVLVELSGYFKDLCSKTIEKYVVNKLSNDIILILCKLEMLYPPNFFVVMIHLAIHLPREIELGGPVQYRWMYPMERYLGTLKKFVRNKAHPEGCIAESYIAKECLNFCSRYLQGVETTTNRVDRHDDGPEPNFEGFILFNERARTLGGGTPEKLSPSEFTKIQWYILNNCEDIEQYFDMHKDGFLKQNPYGTEADLQADFPSWFKQHVSRLYMNGQIKKTDHLYSLGLGPDERVTRYAGLISNGVRYHTVQHEKGHHTQNSGIVVEGDHKSEIIDFYGVLVDIIRVQYCYGCQVFLFKCDWFDVGDRRNGIKSDSYLTSVNMSKKWYIDEPYILASQANQVFYISDIKNGGNWHVVVKVHPRHVYDVPEQLEDIDPMYDHEPYQQDGSVNATEVQIQDQPIESLAREGESPTLVAAGDTMVVLEVQTEDAIESVDTTDEEEDDTLVDYGSIDVDDEEDDY